MSREQAAAGALVGVRGAEGDCMLARSELAPILDDEALTRQLGDAEARVLVEWLVDEAERLADAAASDTASRTMQRLYRRGRAIACFVRLWSLEPTWGPALPLAATDRFSWPMP